jgi:hypothetical protein
VEGARTVPYGKACSFWNELAILIVDSRRDGKIEKYIYIMTRHRISLHPTPESASKLSKKAGLVEFRGMNRRIKIASPPICLFGQRTWRKEPVSI